MAGSGFISIVSTERKNVGCRERGSVLVLALLFIFVIITVVALAIDAVVALNAKSQYERTALDASLAALETYVSTSGATNVKYDAARDRATAIVNQNVAGVSLASMFIASPTHSLRKWGDPVGTTNGYVRTGRWHFSYNGVYAGCGVGNAFIPCFEPDAAGPNAVQVQMALSGGNGSLGYRFAKFTRAGFGIGQNTQGIGAGAIASLVPRSMVFAVDLSNSSISQTHVGTIKPYVIPVLTTSSCASDTNAISTKMFTSAANFKSFFEALPADRTVAADTSVTNFYQSDYASSCIEVSGSTSDCNGAKFYQDTYAARGAEPFNSIMGGMSTAFSRLAARGTAADGVAIIGFDSETVLNCRTTWSTTNSRTEFVPPIFGATEFQKIYDAVTTNGADRRRMMFFPRYLRTPSANSNVKTSIPMALMRAKDVFNTLPSGDISTKELIVFSDGESNCVISPLTPFCGSAPADIQNSVNQVLTEFDQPTDSFIANRIAFNMFIFAKTSSSPSIAVSAPHDVIYAAGGSNGCASHNEMVNGNMPLASFEAATGDSVVSQPVTRNFYVNKLELAVRQSGGLWVPIRPKCDSTGTTDYSSLLQTACNVGNPTAGTAINLYLQLGCTGTCTAGDGCTYVGTDPEICKYVDNQGRLMCDPKNRSYLDQIRAGIEKITEINPFLPVKSGQA